MWLMTLGMLLGGPADAGCGNEAMISEQGYHWLRYETAEQLAERERKGAAIEGETPDATKMPAHGRADAYWLTSTPETALPQRFLVLVEQEGEEVLRHEEKPPFQVPSQQSSGWTGSIVVLPPVSPPFQVHVVDRTAGLRFDYAVSAEGCVKANGTSPWAAEE